MYEDVDWIHLAQHRVEWQSTLNTVMILRAPQEFVKQLSDCEFLKHYSGAWSWIVTKPFCKYTRIVAYERLVVGGR
jgi:hypothetical protein